MTTDDATEDLEPTEAKVNKAHDDHGSDTIDAMLLSLVHTAQLDPDYTIDVTLTVRGATVTGTLVGRNAWLQLLHESLGSRPDGLTAQWMEHFSYDPKAETDKLRDDVFIHLVNARTMSGGVAVPGFSSEGGRWRGLIAAVDGWSLGKFSPNQDDA